MNLIVSDILFWAVMLVACSVAWDVFIYDKRLEDWEASHPGETYVRHYRKFIRKHGE